MPKITSTYSDAEIAAMDKKRGAMTREQYQRSVTMLAINAPATSGTSTTTTSPASSGTVITNTPSASGTTPPSTVRRATRMGFSVGSLASIAALDRIAEIGYGWVRVSHEMGWGGTIDALAATVVEAHKRGIKVLQSPQVAGKAYKSDATFIAQWRQFCADCVGIAKVDALSLGNEWNHLPFWTSPSSTDPNNATRTIPQYVPTTQALLTWHGAQAARAINPLIPVATPGMSPESSVLNPSAWWPTFFDCDKGNMIAASLTAVDVHPYVWPEDPSTNPIQWNPGLQTPDIVSAAKARGMSGEIWYGEIGAPGYPAGTTIPTVRGYLLDEARQQVCYNGYFKVIRSHEAAGINIRNIMWTTMFDGQSVSTPGPEQYFGIIRSDGTKKPVWQMLKDFGDELVAP